MMHQLAAALGAGTVVFGAAPALFPRFFGRLFGIASLDQPSVATVIRSVGIRDLVIGVGLWRAARVRNDRAMRQWLLARAACDAGDTLAVAIGAGAGERNPRFLRLGALALGATLFGAALARATREDRARSRHDGVAMASPGEPGDPSFDY